LISVAFSVVKIKGVGYYADVRNVLAFFDGSTCELSIVILTMLGRDPLSKFRISCRFSLRRFGFLCLLVSSFVSLAWAGEQGLDTLQHDHVTAPSPATVALGVEELFG